VALLGHLFELGPNSKCPFYSLLEGKGRLCSALAPSDAHDGGGSPCPESEATSCPCEGTWQWKLSGNESNVFGFSWRLLFASCLQLFYGVYFPLLSPSLSSKMPVKSPIQNTKVER